MSLSFGNPHNHILRFEYRYCADIQCLFKENTLSKAWRKRRTDHLTVSACASNKHLWVTMSLRTSHSSHVCTFATQFSPTILEMLYPWPCDWATRL